MESALIQTLADRAASCWMEVTLFRDQETKRVLYMEAGHDFVNLLLSILVLPVASLVTRLAEQIGVPASMCAVSKVLKCTRLLDEDRVHGDEFSSPEVSSVSGEYGAMPAAGLLDVAVKCDGVRGTEALATITRWCLQGWMKKNKGRALICDNCKSVEDTMGHAKRIVEHKMMNPSFRAASFSKRPFIVTDSLEIWIASGDNIRHLLAKLQISSPERLQPYRIHVMPEQAQQLLLVSFTSEHALNDVFPHNDPPAE